MADSIAARLDRVRERIAAAAEQSGRRGGEIILVGATKTVPATQVAEAARAGLQHVGENYVQEAQAKHAKLAEWAPTLSWHLLGHLQTNKARVAAELFAIIQTVDSIRIGELLARHAQARASRLRVLLEVDYTRLPDRTGVRPDAVNPTVEALLALPALEVAGLMTVPAPGLAPDAVRAVYRELRRLRDDLAVRYPSVHWDHLSMGMSDDFELAIHEGATMVRIGRAIFGERP
jgi:pyridoxal phosphate enzyme (YggS family)